jgi:hypothetical protein
LYYFILPIVPKEGPTEWGLRRRTKPQTDSLVSLN